MLTILLWGSLLLLGYIYFGYPLAAILLSRVMRREVRTADITPPVTVIITAFNEVAHIEEKIRNVLELEYPPGLLDVIVASDASTDGTDELVCALGIPNVRLLRVEGRKGKTACQNAAVQASTGEIVVLTDATTRIEPHAVRVMVRNFHDPDVGCVAARLKYLASGDGATGKGGTSYWSYEVGLRMAESAIGSLIGVSGCLYAIRRSAYRAIAPELISDFVIAMVVREQGLRTVLEMDALCYEDTLERQDHELSMRIRVGLRSLSALACKKEFLNPLQYGLFAWQLWSHKLLRYLSPVFWGVALISNAALAMQGRYLWLLALQLILLGAGLLGFVLNRVLSGSRILSKPYYFLLTNLASAISLFRFARGDRVVTWTPVR